MWKDKYLKEALGDLDKLDSELREIVLAGIKKVRQNLYFNPKVVTINH